MILLGILQKLLLIPLMILVLLLKRLTTYLAKKDILSNQAIFPVVHEYEVYKSLSQVKKTSPGPDNIPYWLFQTLCYGTHTYYYTYH